MLSWYVVIIVIVAKSDFWAGKFDFLGSECFLNNFVSGLGFPIGGCVDDSEVSESECSVLVEQVSDILDNLGLLLGQLKDATLSHELFWGGRWGSFIAVAANAISITTEVIETKLALQVGYEHLYGIGFIELFETHLSHFEARIV